MPTSDEIRRPSPHPLTVIAESIRWARAAGHRIRFGAFGVHCVSSHAADRWEPDPRDSGIDPLGAAILHRQPMATDPYEAAAEAPAAPSSPPVQEPPLLTFAEAMEAVDRGEAVAEVARLRGALEQAGEEFMTLHGSCRCENESPETCGCAGDGLDEEGGSIEGGCWKCYGAYLTHVAAGTWDEPAPLPLLTFAEAMDALVAGRDVEQRQYDGSWLPLASAQDMNRSQAKPTAEQLAKDARATYRLGSGSGKKGDSTE